MQQRRHEQGKQARKRAKTTNSTRGEHTIDDATHHEHPRVDRTSTDSSTYDEDRGSKLDCSFARESVGAIC